MKNLPQVYFCCFLSGKRARGRPQERWSDELRKVAGQNWVEKAGKKLRRPIPERGLSYHKNLLNFKLIS